MPTPLSIALTPGYQFAANEKITADKLNQLGQPAVDLAGTIGAASIDPGSVDTVALHDNALSADATGRAKMQDGFVDTDKLGALAVTAAKLADGAVTATKMAGGVVQVVHAETASVFTCNTVIPYDNTIPQRTEGNEILTASITPQAMTTRLRVVARVLVQTPPGNRAVAAIFQDLIDAALVASSTYVEGNATTITLEVVLNSVDLTTRTFKLRVGPAVGTVYVNADAGVRLFGGVCKVHLDVEEIW